MKIPMTKRIIAVVLAIPILLLFPLFSFAEDTGPYQILVYEPTDIQDGIAKIEIRVEDAEGIGWREIWAETTYNGFRYDLRASLEEYGRAIIEITANTDIVVTVTAPDGKLYADSRRAHLFEEASAPESSSPSSAPDRGVGAETAPGNASDSQSESLRVKQETSAASESAVDQADESSSSPASGKKTSMEQAAQEDAADDSSGEETVPPMNTDGTSTVIDNELIGPQQREFFTFQTPLGNHFYLVIDRNKDNNNVFFLNAVTERDLLDLAEDESWVAERATEVEDGAIPDPDASDGESASGEPDDETSADDAQPEDETELSPDSGGGSHLIVVGVVLVIALGAGYYIKIVRPKKALDNADDLEDIEYLDDGEDEYGDEDYSFGEGDTEDSL